ncbi:hypothetical protein RB620_20490 [Paenibacillus sp. LHD-117]|uniref:hypothetical protein n=1 Tax=Paenibacillus sp. LHD-117 TaxID=3071412 RepID=UPI0027E004B3|nr:hypothetical protein [Paenibacillus sp. LHD-117]MDQ6421810.1 hypothetical protein [Paenibacillus sp. LHD-117]
MPIVWKKVRVLVLDWILAIFLWIIALSAIIYGLYLTKEVHKENGVMDYAILPSSFNHVSDSIWGWIAGAVLGILAGLFVGLFFKLLPWWLARGVLIVIGIGLLVLGVMLVRN